MEQDAPQQPDMQQPPPTEPIAAPPVMSEEQATNVPVQQAFGAPAMNVMAGMQTQTLHATAPSHLQPQALSATQALAQFCAPPSAAQDPTAPSSEQKQELFAAPLQADSELTSQVQSVQAEIGVKMAADESQQEAFADASVPEREPEQQQQDQQDQQMDQQEQEQTHEAIEEQSTELMGAMQVEVEQPASEAVELAAQPQPEELSLPQNTEQSTEQQRAEQLIDQLNANSNPNAQAAQQEQQVETEQVTDQVEVEVDNVAMMSAVTDNENGNVRESEFAMQSVQGEDTAQTTLETQNNTEHTEHSAHDNMDSTNTNSNSHDANTNAMNVDEAEDEDIDVAQSQSQTQPRTLPPQIQDSPDPQQQPQQEQQENIPNFLPSTNEAVQEAMPEPMDTDEADIAADVQPKAEITSESAQPQGSANPSLGSNQSISGAQRELEECRALLAEFMQRQESEPFNEPVDWQGLNLPEYPQIVKRPMDLGTAAQKLAAGKYNNAEAFAVDVRLTFKNAKTFNQPGSGIFVVADNLSMQFERRYARINKQSAGKRRSAASIGKDASTFEQRQRFTTMVQQLSAAELGGVVELLEARSPLALSAAPGDDEELEIEVYDIKGDVLKDLITHMQKTIDKRSNSKRRKKN